VLAVRSGAGAREVPSWERVNERLEMADGRDRLTFTSARWDEKSGPNDVAS
jgi:hypothetical protein